MGNNNNIDTNNITSQINSINSKNSSKNVWSLNPTQHPALSSPASTRREIKLIDPELPQAFKDRQRLLQERMDSIAASRLQEQENNKVSSNNQNNQTSSSKSNNNNNLDINNQMTNSYSSCPSF